MTGLVEGKPTRTNRGWPASFKDRLTAPLPGVRDLIRVMREGGFRTDPADAPRIPVTRSSGLPAVTAEDAAVTWIGHATFAVRIGGITVLTDPVFSRKIPGVKPRITPVGVDLPAINPVDAVVISHNHYDHLDAPSVRRLPRDTPVLVPAKLGDWFRRRDFRNVTELDWWESHTVDGVRFEFVPAHHWSRRTITDTCKTLWGGWIISTDDTIDTGGGADTAGGAAAHKIYFAGDTAYGHWFSQIAGRHPDIDLALMPVGAYEPSWFMHNAHMSPQEAVRACADLGVSRMATMHWGTFMLSAEPLLAPVEQARRAWQEAGRPRDDLWDLAVGESRVL